MSENRRRCHQVLGVLTAFWATLLQVKFQASNASPFVTRYAIMYSLCFTVFVYSLTVFAEFIVEIETLGNMSLCLGALPSILLMLILLPILGWFALGIWALFFSVVLWKTFQQLYTLFWEAILTIGNSMPMIDPPNPPQVYCMCILTGESLWVFLYAFV